MTHSNETKFGEVTVYHFEGIKAYVSFPSFRPDGSQGIKEFIQDLEKAAALVEQINATLQG